MASKQRQTRSNKINKFLKIGVPTPVHPAPKESEEGIPWKGYLDVNKYIPITLWTRPNVPILTVGVTLYQNSNLMVGHVIPKPDAGFFVYGDYAYETVNGIIQNIVSLETYF